MHSSQSRLGRLKPNARSCGGRCLLPLTPTFAQPTALSEGIRFVLVNGKVVFADGKMTGELPGRVLRGPGYRER
jgi:uncharacterized Zn-binding protein involved in type VI secretion